MADINPQLKRKREEAAAQKKAKKQRKEEAAAALEDSRNDKPTISVTDSTLKSDKTTTPKKQSRLAPQTNGVDKDAANGTPTSAQKASKPQAQQNGSVDDDEAQAAGATVNGIAGEVAQAEKEKPNGVTNVVDKAARKKAKKERKEKNRAERNDLGKSETLELVKRKKSKRSGTWVVSPAQGGWYLSADPIFSKDEKYLIVANLKSLCVYATDTSLLVSELLDNDTGSLTAYALSNVAPHLIYAAYSSGEIVLWDWVMGKKTGRWDIGTTVQNMAVITQPESDQDLVYCHEAEDGHSLTLRSLRTKSQSSAGETKSDLKQILNTGSAIRGIQVLLQGKYVIVATVDSLIVGKRVKITKTALHEFEYVWRELKFSKHIRTFNVYHREKQEVINGRKGAQDQRDILDVAVGEETGLILLFEDILASFAAVESSQKGKKERTDTAESLRPKRLHWHRDAVGSVKWSLDGNYIVSGGDETVLTIWQLATGLPQHLPHLSAAIENIVISPTGSAYALTLANNSVIVLSTAELEARTNIVGIQSRRIDTEQMPKETKSGNKYLGIFEAVPMTVDPTNPNEVSLAVPSSQPRQRKGGLKPEPYLQTFDLANQRAKGRQALTRNNATEPNIAPDGGRIEEPNVTHIQISHDGEWLATVDEWLPPKSDTHYLNEGIPEFNEQERLNRREVYLKIWRRDNNSGQWKLETRIDAPHFFEDRCGNGRVYDLVADPTGAAFATVGEDHVVRIWKPKTRLRDGVIVRGARQEGLITWSLDHAVEISDKLDITEESQQSLPPRTSRLAFSADGSVLAMSVSWNFEEDAGVTHLIDTSSGTIRRSLTEIDVTALSGLGFVGQYLVVVADVITVWDMVADQLVYSVSIETPGLDRLERVPLVRLATNETDGTFSVALPRLEKSELHGSKIKKASSKVLIYSPEHHKALWRETLSPMSLALASRRSESGYIVLDSRSCLKTISPSAGPLQLLTPPPEEQLEAHRITHPYEIDMEDDEPEQPLANLLVSEDLTQDIDQDEHVFSMQDLQNVLHDGSVPPPPQGLFSNILALIGGKTQKVPA